MRGLGTKVTVTFGPVKFSMVETDETAVGKFVAGVSGVELGFGGSFTKGTVWTLGEIEGLLAGVATAMFGLAEVATNGAV